MWFVLGRGIWFRRPCPNAAKRTRTGTYAGLSSSGENKSNAQAKQHQTRQRQSLRIGFLSPLVRALWQSGSGSRSLKLPSAQSLQNPLIKEYTLNHIRDPNIFYAIFLNQGVLEVLGAPMLARPECPSASQPRPGPTASAPRLEITLPRIALYYCCILVQYNKA